MTKRRTYKDYMAAVGRKPPPPYNKLRTTKKPGDKELAPGTVHQH